MDIFSTFSSKSSKMRLVVEEAFCFGLSSDTEQSRLGLCVDANFGCILYLSFTLGIVLTADELEDPEYNVEFPDSDDAAAVEESPDSDEFSAELVDIIRDSSTVPSS
mmetsp:Transcript_1798/g.3186  ORF Transcript_1798/g.3186 Transcript_1798/m.3186 type:complete len:107 (+) Transcript_1798:115-435(+)